jgi:dihydrofolate reductase
VDEYRIMVFPIILGGGKRMFPNSMPDPAALTLSESATVGSGVQLLTLHPAPAAG